MRVPFSRDLLEGPPTYGRVTTDGGIAYVGRLRFGRNEEAFWGDYFNGIKSDNPWVTHAPAEVRAWKRRPLTTFGFEIIRGERQVDLSRPFMARFGDIARIEARSLHHVRVTLKSGTIFDLNRMAANDFDAGVHVWDERQGVVDLASWAGGLPPPAPCASAPSSFCRMLSLARRDLDSTLLYNILLCGMTTISFGAVGMLAALASISVPQSGELSRCDTGPHLGFTWVCRGCVLSPEGAGTIEFREPPSVGEVNPDGPVYQLLRTGDRILAVDGASITSPRATARLARLQPGDSLVLRVERAAEQLEVRLIVGGRCPERKSGLLHPVR